MNLDLLGKRALVCGSTQGIGKASAIELALLGARVTLVARDEEKLKLTVAELHRAGEQQHDYFVADFSKPDELRSKVHEYAAKHTIHILVNNTGGPPAGQAIDSKPEDFIAAFNN